MAGKRKRRRKNYKLGVSPWLLPVSLTVGLVVAGGILAYKSRKKKSAALGGGA